MEEEVTRIHMEETRTPLWEKLEALERRVVGSPQGADNATGESEETVMKPSRS